MSGSADRERLVCADKGLRVVPDVAQLLGQAGEGVAPD